MENTSFRSRVINMQRGESITIPVDNETLPHSMWGKTLELYGYVTSVVECNLKLNGEYLRNALGIVEETE